MLRPVSHMETLKLLLPEKMLCPMQSYECCPLNETQRELAISGMIAKLYVPY